MDLKSVISFREIIKEIVSVLVGEIENYYTKKLHAYGKENR